MDGIRSAPSRPFRAGPSMVTTPCNDARSPQKHTNGPSAPLAPDMKSVTPASSRPSSANYSTDGTVTSLRLDVVAGGDYLAKLSTPKDSGKQPVYVNKNTSIPFSALVLYDLPWNVTYDLILDVVSPFGKIVNFQWTPIDPCVCKVVYLDKPSAERAMSFLDGKEVFKDRSPVRAKLLALNSDLQLAIQNVSQGWTEDNLELHFKNLVKSQVYAILNRDPNTNYLLGHGIISFFSPEAVRLALHSNGSKFRGGFIDLHALSPTSVCLHTTNMGPSVSHQDLQNLYGKFGHLNASSISLYHRTYAFVKFENRESTELAKRELNNAFLKDRMCVRYGEGEQNRSTVQVQFQASEERDVLEVRQEVIEAFSKYGECAVDVEQWSNGDWRRLAFVTYKGNSTVSFAATLKALDSVTEVGSNNVWCQWARELIPRVQPMAMRVVLPPYNPTSMVDFVRSHTDQVHYSGVPANRTGTAQFSHVSRPHITPYQAAPRASAVPEPAQVEMQNSAGTMPNTNQAELIEVAMPTQHAVAMGYLPPYSLYWNGAQYVYLPTGMYQHYRPTPPQPYYYNPGYLQPGMPPQQNVAIHAHNMAPPTDPGNAPRTQA